MSMQLINSVIIQNWLNDNLDITNVSQKLQSMDVDEQTKEAYILEYKKQKNAKRQFNGFLYLGIGAFLGFLGCVLTIINPFPELYNVILFSITTISVLIIFLGLYNLFE